MDESCFVKHANDNFPGRSTLATAGNQGIDFEKKRSAPAGLIFSVSLGGGFGAVATMCKTNAADSVKGILSKVMDNFRSSRNGDLYNPGP